MKARQVYSDLMKDLDDIITDIINFKNDYYGFIIEDDLDINTLDRLCSSLSLFSDFLLKKYQETI